MNQELKRKWVDALRSGAYTQIKAALMNRDMSGKLTGACALGVLFDVWERAGKPPTEQYAYLGVTDAHFSDIARLNDKEGKTFPEIADWIEANVK